MEPFCSITISTEKGNKLSWNYSSMKPPKLISHYHSLCQHQFPLYPDVRLLDLQWNPGSGFPNLLLVVVSTGVVSLLEITDKVTVLVRRAVLQANCGELRISVCMHTCGYKIP